MILLLMFSFSKTFHIHERIALGNDNPPALAIDDVLPAALRARLFESEEALARLTKKLKKPDW